MFFSSLIVSELVAFFQCFQTLLLAFLEGKDNPLAEHGFTTLSDRRPSSPLFMLFRSQVSAFSPKSNAEVLTRVIAPRVLTVQWHRAIFLNAETNF